MTPKKRKSKALILFIVLVALVMFLKEAELHKHSNTVVKMPPPEKVANKEAPSEPVTAKINQQVKTIWQIKTDIDEMTGARTHSAQSPIASPKQQMTFPYEKVKAKLVVSCHKREEKVHFEFSQSLNLANTTTHSNYQAFRTRIKWNSSVDAIELFVYSDRKCSGQLIPDSELDRSSAFAGGTPLLN
jgi:acyl-CoA thioesterase